MMNEGEVRMLAKLQALMTERDSINTCVAGMVAENQQRAVLGLSMAYGESDFAYEADRLEVLAARMMEEV